MARPALVTLHALPRRIPTPPAIRQLLRTYASQTGIGPSKSEQPRHQRVTVFNDDGHVSWGQLTTGEKVARTAQQSFNFTLIAGGAAATV